MYKLSFTDGSSLEINETDKVNVENAVSDITAETVVVQGKSYPVHQLGNITNSVAPESIRQIAALKKIIFGLKDYIDGAHFPECRITSDYTDVWDNEQKCYVKVFTPIEYQGTETPKLLLGKYVERLKALTSQA